MNQPKNPSYQLVRNTATNINGREFTGHALDRMQDRGILPSVVDNAIMHGNPSPGRGSTTKYYDAINNVSTVISDKGDRKSVV